MENWMLVRYGELTLKGKNKRFFTQRVIELIKEKTSDLSIALDIRHDRIYLNYKNEDPQVVIHRLNRVSGLYSYSLIEKCSLDFDEIANKAIPLLEARIHGKPISFKVETKRADKTFPLTSMEISKQISGKLLRAIPLLVVDVHHPELTLSIEIRQDGAYLFVDQIKGMGGYPVGMGGKALVMLSGGIDSPVAGYLMMKQGVEIECIHFESSPMTPIESVQKTIDLVQTLAAYAPNNTIKLHLIPFEPIHSSIITHVPESYVITIMRRMMYRIATEVMKRSKSLALVNGESIGQVASQTLESMQCVSSVTDALIIRPLATYDKLDIMAVARTIETLSISNRPFEDCCTVYLPQNPSIRPQTSLALDFEKRIDYEPMILEAVKKRVILSLNYHQPYSIIGKGLTVEDAIHGDHA